MQKLYLTIISALLLTLSGCANFGLDEMGCPPAPTTVLTAVDAKSTNAPSFVRVSRDTVAINKGCDFVIKNTQGHEIETVPENNTDGWLRAGPVNTDITLRAPADAAEGDHKFTIIVTGIGQLDPRARVR